MKTYTDDMQVAMKMSDRAGVMSGLMFSMKHGLGKQFFVPTGVQNANRDVLEYARKRVRATARCLVRQRAGRVHTGWCTVAHFETYTGVYERLVEEHRCSAHGSAAVVSRPQCPRLVNLVPDPGQDGGEARLSACSETSTSSFRLSHHNFRDLIDILEGQRERDIQEGPKWEVDGNM